MTKFDGYLLKWSSFQLIQRPVTSPAQPSLVIIKYSVIIIKAIFSADLIRVVRSNINNNSSGAGARLVVIWTPHVWISHISYLVFHISYPLSISVSMEIRLDTLLQIANYEAKLLSLSDSTISHTVRMKTGIMYAADNWIFSCGWRYIISPGGDKVGQALTFLPIFPGIMSACLISSVPHRHTHWRLCLWLDQAT